ncbi:unnamed protein product [Rotaria socialis]|uniref:Polyadenylate-binding protein n=1 Tax=Rotaria socialis TaxID=392032 RepID=A0A821I1E1_9BILA|nr:unnamed protein product [Rotaria socialis]CAF4697199.1 unnamed protein product [Rotaria socialis]
MATNTAVGAPNNPMASLYVGHLHAGVTEAMLFDKFASAGTILSIRVCRDMITRRSLGYAYVNFQEAADAKLALDTMNFDILCGRPLRIMWQQRDRALHKSGVNNVFIKNLDKSIDNKSLYDTFSAFGNILSCKIMTDESGQPKGFGFVHFESQEAADIAINKVNGMLLADKKVFVGRFSSRNQRTDPSGPRKFTNIFLKNFGDQLDEEKFRELFSKYGKITSLKLVTDDSGHSKGFGFCSFDTPEEAEQAVENLNGFTVGDKQLFVGRFQKKNQRLSQMKRKKEVERQEPMNKYQGVNLYIKNLDDTIDNECLRKEFSKFGMITSAKIMSENGRSKGFGFVCFSAPDEATKAIKEMNGTTVGSKPLYVALAQRKEERRMHLTNQHMQLMTTSHVHPPMQLSVPSNARVMMSYPPTLLPEYRRAQPRWSPAAPNSGMIPPSGAQLIGMQMPQTAMAGVVSRAGMPVSTRPIPGQMMPNNSGRLQGGMQQEPATAYTRSARKTLQSNAGGFGNSIVVPGQESLTPAGLANATPQEQKQMLGERLFPLIQIMQPELAGKITGMLLEIDNTELLHMLESRESLKAKVEEAIAVLQAHQAKQCFAAKLAVNNSAAS